MSTEFDPKKGEALLRDAEDWQRRQDEAGKNSFTAVAERLKAAVAALPENPVVPYHLTDQGVRWASFKKVCDERFLPKVDYTLVKNREAFDRVLNWDGKCPGICATGETGMGKTFASWAALRRLYVLENRAFAWFPAKRLCTEMAKYEEKNCMEDFYRSYNLLHILFVDDLEKINWQFQSNSEMLFAFFDWVYRAKKPCMVTTNCSRDWWKDKMGDAFARRLFDEAHTVVQF